MKAENWAAQRAARTVEHSVVQWVALKVALMAGLRAVPTADSKAAC